jgi:hypothetical protein
MGATTRAKRRAPRKAKKRQRKAEPATLVPVGYLGKVKKAVGCSVQLTNGQKFLFGPGTAWEWSTVADEVMLQVWENGVLALQARREHVVCVTGPATFFRDREW